MARQRHKRPQVMFGFRLFYPDGALMAEYWLDPEQSRVNVVNYGVEGLPTSAGNATWEYFMRALTKAHPAPPSGTAP